LVQQPPAFGLELELELLLRPPRLVVLLLERKISTSHNLMRKGKILMKQKSRMRLRPKTKKRRKHLERHVERAAFERCSGSVGAVTLLNPS
jgi:hypothetical protein